jgi:Protein of unknown function (DUF1579)
MTAVNRGYSQNDDAMKAWQNYMTPGEVHKMLAASNGTWAEDITMWMAPGAPPTKSVASAENTMILGGRYQQSVSKGNFNGMDFEGIGILGYDNAKKIFMNSWVDNMGTGITQMQGPWDPATKTVTLTGTSVDPTTGRDVKVKETFAMIDNNTQVMTMYTNQDGKEYKSMEIKFTRK